MMFNWISFLTYAVITAATPGPNNIMSMTNAGKLGLKKSLPFNLGIWAGFTVVMVICTVLSKAFHTILPLVKTPMLVIGAAYMFWLAWQTFKSDSAFKAKQVRGGFYSGLFLQFINPKIYIYCIVSMEAYILPFYQDDPARLFAFAVLLAAIGFVFTLCWAAFGSLFKLLFSQYAKVTNTVMALLLVYCAVSLFM